MIHGARVDDSRCVFLEDQPLSDPDVASRVSPTERLFRAGTRLPLRYPR